MRSNTPTDFESYNGSGQPVRHRKPSKLGFVVTQHAQQRADERGASRRLIFAALSHRPTARLSDGLTVFSASGFAVLVDLTTRRVVTVLPRDAAPKVTSTRDAGCVGRQRGYRRQRGIAGRATV